MARVVKFRSQKQEPKGGDVSAYFGQPSRPPGKRDVVSDQLRHLSTGSASGRRPLRAQCSYWHDDQNLLTGRLFVHAETAFGGVDVLVDNAGIMPLATFKDADDALFDSTIAINLKGVFNGNARGG